MKPVTREPTVGELVRVRHNPERVWVVESIERVRIIKAPLVSRGYRLASIPAGVQEVPVRTVNAFRLGPAADRHPQGAKKPSSVSSYRHVIVSDLSEILEDS